MIDVTSITNTVLEEVSLSEACKLRLINPKKLSSNSTSISYSLILKVAPWALPETIVKSSLSLSTSLT